jgi:hypothetical protein
MCMAAVVAVLNFLHAVDSYASFFPQEPPGINQKFSHAFPQ